MTKKEAKQTAKFTRDTLALMNGRNGLHWAKGALESAYNWLGKVPRDNKKCYCIEGALAEVVMKSRARNKYETYLMVKQQIKTQLPKFGYTSAIPSFNDNQFTLWKDVKKVLTKVAEDFDKLAEGTK